MKGSTKFWIAMVISFYLYLSIHLFFMIDPNTHGCWKGLCWFIMTLSYLVFDAFWFVSRVGGEPPYRGIFYWLVFVPVILWVLIPMLTFVDEVLNRFNKWLDKILD